ncbi:glycerate kinase [soil metagenome]
MTTVLIAPDKFKGSLSAAEVAETLAEGFTEAGMDVLTLPLADGGDGSVAAALAAGFIKHTISVQSATGASHPAVIAVSGDTAVVEVANTCGLGTLPGDRLAPLSASSFGFGQAIRSAMDLGVRRVVLALGGSASSDAGIGMLAALGFRFLDRAGRVVPATAENLGVIQRVTADVLPPVELIVASDVTNPLLGADGAAAVYGPQKGATVADIDVLEAGHENVVVAFARSGWADAGAVAQMSGAGAAGGCGFAAALLGARIVSGATFFLDLLGFEKYCQQADLVITGEGRLDSQTLRGKLPSVVAQRAFPKPVVAVVGRNDLGRTSDAPFVDIRTVGDYSPADTAHDPVGTRAALHAIARVIAADVSRQATG